MKKNFFKNTCLVLLTVFSLSMPLTSCSFFDTGNGTQISNVETKYDEKTGNTIITISFTNDDMTPVSFTIPQGIAGKDGVSIKNVSSILSSDGTSVILTISYSDPNIENTVISVPVLQGKGIKEVLVNKDENGNTTIQFVYTDNSTSSKITIPNGKDGNGIENFEVSDADKNGEITITVSFTDGNTKTFKIKNGVSIYKITYNEEKSDDTHYVLTITYTDGYSEDVSLDRPKSNIWYTGTTAPEDDSTASSKAEDGDFYLNKLNGYVYQKDSNGTWNYLFSMKAESSSKDTYYTVYFDPGEGKINGKNNIIASYVSEGKTMRCSQIPIPEYEGYTFLGWYTDLNNVNSGKFTDLTPVFNDISLYAKYEKIQG